MPEEYVTPPTRSTSVLRFVVIAIVLVALLVAGFYFGKQYLDTQKEATVTTSSDKKENKQKSNSDSDKQKEKEQREKREAEQAEAKREEAKKKAEAERRQAQSPAALPGDVAPSSSSPDHQVATTGPHEVASTGPEDALIALTGVLALVYAAFTFVRSRQALSHSLDKSLQARK